MLCISDPVGIFYILDHSFVLYNISINRQQKVRKMVRGKIMEAFNEAEIGSELDKILKYI